MRFFSIHQLADQGGRLARRFPVSLLVTLVGTAALVRVTVFDILDVAFSDREEAIMVKIFFVALLAFPWVTCVSLITEKYHWSLGRRLLAQFGASAVCSAYYFVLSGSPEDFRFFFFDHRLFALIAAGFLLLLTLPFDQRDPLRFWRYLASSVRSAVIALAFSAGLGMGLTISFFAIFYLFQTGGSFDEEWVMLVWQIMFGIVATWIFLANLPSPNAPPRVEKLPRILQRFVSVIWIPIVVVFFAILYAYLGKILITQDWPEGGVVYWIFAFSMAGLLAFLTSYESLPVARWKQILFRVFFVSILPMLVVYIIAIGFRILPYGITVNRYFVVLSGVWLAVVAVYLLLSRSKKIQWISYLTIIFLLFSVFGPWSASSVSMFSQSQRLEDLLVKNQLLVNGKISRDRKSVVSYAEYRDVKSAMEYVILRGGVARIQPWFSEELALDDGSRRELSEKAFSLLSLTYEGADEETQLGGYRVYFWRDASNDRLSGSDFLNVRGYDFAIPSFYFDFKGITQWVKSDFGNLRFEENKSGQAILILQSTTDEKERVLATIDFAQELKRLNEKYGVREAKVDPTDIDVVIENEAISLKLIIKNISGRKIGETFVPSHVQLTILGTLKSL